MIHFHTPGRGPAGPHILGVSLLCAVSLHNCSFYPLPLPTTFTIPLLKVHRALFSAVNNVTKLFGVSTDCSKSEKKL